MTRLPWHVALVPNRRALLTAGGIALGVAFAVLSFSVVGALGETTIQLGEHLREGDVALARPGMEPFRPAELGLSRAAVGVLRVDVTTGEGEVVTLVALEGEGAPDVPPGAFAVVVGYDRFPAALHIVQPADATLAKGAAMPHDGLTTAAWPRVAPEEIRALDSTLADGRISYALAKGLSEKEVERLAGNGFLVHPAPAVDPFFGTSSTEIARSLFVVVVVASVLAALFTYEFFRSELRLKRREIALWRAVGMRGRDVLALLLARATALGALGVALGTGVAYAALGAAVIATREEIFAPQLRPVALLGLVLCFVAAAVAGSLPPAVRAVRATVAHGLEVPA